MTSNPSQSFAFTVSTYRIVKFISMAERSSGSDDRAYLKVAFSIHVCQFEDKFSHIFQHLTILCKMGNLNFGVLSNTIFKYAKFSYESHISVSSSEF